MTTQEAARRYFLSVVDRLEENYPEVVKCVNRDFPLDAIAFEERTEAADTQGLSIKTNEFTVSLPDVYNLERFDDPRLFMATHVPLGYMKTTQGFEQFLDLPYEYAVGVAHELAWATMNEFHEFHWSLKDLIHHGGNDIRFLDYIFVHDRHFMRLWEEHNAQ